MMRKLRTKFIGYFITGGLAAVIDAVVFLLLVNAGLVPAPSAIISFVVSAIFNYFVSSHFVFRYAWSKTGFAKFLVAAAMGLTINVGVTMAMLSLLSFPPLAAKLTGTSTAFAFNFVLNALLVFPQRRAQDGIPTSGS